MGGEAARDEPGVDKGNDFWFRAQWVVGVGPLTEYQRRQAFLDLCRLTGDVGLDDPRKIDPARVKGVDAEKLREIGGDLSELAKTWLVTRDDLASVAAEGVTKEWPGWSAPAAGGVGGEEP